MEIITITAYRGLSVVSGSIDIRKLFEFIRGSVYRDKIRRLRETMEMPAEKIPGYRQLVNDCPDTLGDFISPRMHGLKIFVYLTGEEPEALRAELNALGTIDLPTLERYHHRMYALASQKYEELLHTKVDTSGSDLSRGFFASHDPEAFLSPERLENVKPLTVRVTLPTEEECKNKKRRKSTPQPPLLPTQENAAPIDLQVQLDFRKAMEYTRRKERLETGNRDNFFYCLGNQCYRRHITEEEAVSLTRSNFGDIPDFDLEQPLRNAYQYTSKTDREEKESHEPKICKMIRFMDEYYEIRRNIVKELIEFRRKPTTTDEKASSDFAILRAKDVNTFYINAQMKGISCSQNSLKALVDSDYAKPFNPFTHYFFSLPTWNGKTDYIAQLAQRVKTTDPAFFIDSLRHWLVGMVACAIDDKVQNQQLLLLHGGQGSGKSTFIRKLLPPELDTYYRCGMIIPENKDHLLQLSSSLIIDLDEFDTLPSWQMQSLKRLIVQGVVTERKVFDLQMNNFIRRASFIASTNDQHFLVDILENRRYLINTILSIDNSGPVNHKGIYAQALALYRQGYRYWYEKEEVTFLNKRNESFRQKDPVEENLFFYFRAAKGGEIQAKWYPASYLLSILSLNGRTQSNPQTQKTLVTVLEKNHFINRNGNYGVTEYKVVEYTPEEREANSTLPQIPKQGNFDL